MSHEEQVRPIPPGWTDLGFTDKSVAHDEEPVYFDGFGSPVYSWAIPLTNVDPEVLEILFGEAVVPLCNRQIPAEGTE